MICKPSTAAHPHPPTWRLLRTVMLTVLSLAVLACSPPGDPAEHRKLALAHLEEGDAEAALDELRKAMALAPEDGDLHLLTARAHLAEGRGPAAEEALDHALALGVAHPLTLVPRARALLLQQDYAAVAALEVPDRAADRIHLGVSQAKLQARAAQADPDRLSDELTREYLAFFDAVADGDPADLQLAAPFENERQLRVEAERAWQHHACRWNQPEIAGWRPLAVADDRRVLRVGPAHRYRNPAEAAEAARDGDVVEIDAGVYEGGIALWPQSGILVRGVGGRPLITAAGRGIERRDVWLFTGDAVSVENVAISGARSPYGNGAGIRHIGSGLTLRHVLLEDNENGVLTGNNRPDSRIIIEHSEFVDNGDGEGWAHNVNIGRSASLELRFSHSHGAKVGHLVASRAEENLIAYNRFSSGLVDAASYLIDLSEGGTATIIGNEMSHGPRSTTPGMISFARESLRHEINALTIASNSVYNQHPEAILARNPNTARVMLVNNLIGGMQLMLCQDGCEDRNNLMQHDPGMRDPSNHDFRLTASAPAVDAATGGPVPEFEYIHPLSYRARDIVWRPDVGAHERCGL